MPELIFFGLIGFVLGVLLCALTIDHALARKKKRYQERGPVPPEWYRRPRVYRELTPKEKDEWGN